MHNQEQSDMAEHHENVVNEFLTRQAYSYIECAVNLAVHTAGMDEVAAYLRIQAELLEEHG